MKGRKFSPQRTAPSSRVELAQAHRAQVLVQSGCARELPSGFETISVPRGTLTFTPVTIKWDRGEVGVFLSIVYGPLASESSQGWELGENADS